MGVFFLEEGIMYKMDLQTEIESFTGKSSAETRFSELRKQIPKKRAVRVNIYNKLFKWVCIMSAIFVCLTLASIVFFIGQTGFKVFEEVDPITFFFSLDWQPEVDIFGAGVFILGTLSLTLLTLAIATPLSIGIAIFTAEIAPNYLKKIIRPVLDLLVGIPSVVYGYLGVTILVPFLREASGSLMGDGLLAAALVLTLMVLPTITRISDDSIRFVPLSYREAAYALGSTRIQMIMKVVLPAAKKGIMTAIVLGMARAIGETMAVVMVIGNTPQLANSLFTPTSVLTSNIVMQITNVQFDTTWSYALYMMAFLLLFISLVMIIGVRLLSGHGGKSL